MIYYNNCFLIFMLLNCSLFVSANERQSWSILSTDEGVTFSVNAAFDLNKRSLDINDSKEDLSSPENVVRLYYKKLKNEDFEGAYSIIYDRDGGRERFRADFFGNNLKIKRLAGVDSLTIDDIKKWAGYYVVDISVFISGRSASLRHEVVCYSECKIIYDYFGVNETNDLVDLSFMTLLESKRVNGSAAFKFKSKPLSIYMPNPFSKVNVKNSLVFNLVLDDFNGNLDFSECNSKKEHRIESKFCSLYISAKNLNADTIGIVDFGFLDLITNKTGDGGFFVNDYFDGSVKSHFYSGYSAVGFIKSWCKIDFLGVLDSELTEFVFFRPIDVDGKEFPIQVVSIDKVSDKLYYGSNWEDAYLFFYNDIFSSELDKILK
ncbi:hypothetical protein [Pseudoalteromonas gelatinilytica]